MTPADLVPIDRAWLAAHPLPECGPVIDKNSRGRVLVAGGSAQVPGALRLTVEAAFRSGAGKVQAATIAAAAIGLGLLLPEAAVIALPAADDGEIAAHAAAILIDAAARCDTLLLGPGMGDEDRAAALVRAVLADAPDDRTVLLDAAAVSCLSTCADAIDGWRGRTVLTPHHGEMAALTRRPIEDVAADPAAIAIATASRLGAIVVLKAGETIVAPPEGRALHYPGGGPGLATGGSGDVLAGIVAALLARGADPLTAAGWGVWLHGEAGRRVSARLGPLGLMARDLPPEIPPLMAGR